MPGHQSIEVRDAPHRAGPLRSAVPDLIRRASAPSAVWPIAVVERAEVLADTIEVALPAEEPDELADGLLECPKQALRPSVRPRVPRARVGELHAKAMKQDSEVSGGELWTVVRDDSRRRTLPRECRLNNPADLGGGRSCSRGHSGLPRTQLRHV
jgi:hypothetical protein